MPYVLYDFQINGTRAGPAAFLEGYDGYVQCDANTVNHGLFVPLKDAPAPLAATEVGCWAHGRRGFYDARLLQPAANEMLDMIGALYGKELDVLRKRAGRTNGSYLAFTDGKCHSAQAQRI